jgi:hypothetical protein
MNRLLHTLVAGVLALGITACGGGYEGTTPPGDTTNLPLALVGPTTLTLIPSELGRVEVTGGTRPYTATSTNKATALASVSDGTLSVAAVQGASAPVTVTVTDAKNAKVTLTVNVTNRPEQGSFALSTRDLALVPGASQALTVSGGTPPFTVVASNASIATASVAYSTVTVVGVSEGVNAGVRVIDSRGVTQTLLVTVAAPTPSPSGLALFSNMPAYLTLRPRTSQTFTLGGGTGPYIAVSSNPAALETTVRGGGLILNAGVGLGGAINVMVGDTNGNTLNHTVRVLNTSAPLALSSSAITGVEGTSTRVGIAGGLPPYRMASALPSVANIVNGDTLAITFGFIGGPKRVTVLDAENNAANLDITSTALLSPITVSPSAITISEQLSRDAAGVAQITTIPLLFLNAKQPLQVFTSHPNLLVPSVNGVAVTVSTPGTVDSPIAPCVDTETKVVITGIDATGSSGSAVVTVIDGGICPL